METKYVLFFWSLIMGPDSDPESVFYMVLILAFTDVLSIPDCARHVDGTSNEVDPG